MLILEKEFYKQGALTLAKKLLGKTLVRNIDNVTLRGKIVETDNGLKYHAEDFLIDKNMTEEYFNNWKKEVIENRMRNYGETYEKAYKNAEILLWNTPFYFDRWLIKNCPIQFIQDRLKYQYDDEYEQIKNGTSAYDTYKRTGLGKNFHRWWIPLSHCVSWISG